MDGFPKPWTPKLLLVVEGMPRGEVLFPTDSIELTALVEIHEQVHGPMRPGFTPKALLSGPMASGAAMHWTHDVHAELTGWVEALKDLIPHGDRKTVHVPAGANAHDVIIDPRATVEKVGAWMGTISFA